VPGIVVGGVTGGLMRRIARRLAVLCTLALCTCTTALHEPRLDPPSDVPPRSTQRDERLKVHLQSGDLVVLEMWARRVDTLAGSGTRYGLDRRDGRHGFFLLPFDSIALVETETRAGSRINPVPGMAVWTTLWAVVTAACVAEPKSCFGSCPTFYVATDSVEVLAAEGFSASIARVLEARDTDALFAARSAGGPFTVRMRNEALETHAVRSLTLLATPRPRGGRVLASGDGQFFPAMALRAAGACRAPEGDCAASLAALDDRERRSAADSTDLAARETLELTFPADTGRLGLVLAARQSLMSTYLFYETLGALGSRAGATLAAIERGGRAAAERAMGMARLIAPIELEVLAGGRWTRIGTHDEAGPLATQVGVLPFIHRDPGPIHIRLTAARGAWRFDWIALARLGDPVTPLALAPQAVRRNGRLDTAALAVLRDPEAHLVTYPGDTYDVEYRLPPAGGEWELFLESEGYYYEWMRSEWLADENPALSLLALTDPAAALRAFAPGFKRAEPAMDRLFWASRFGR
jgi:hypothetical protein